MARSIAEMHRRRTVQLAYNEEHDIVPESIRKEVRSLLAPSEDAESGELSISGLGPKWKERLPLLFANLEEEMHIASERLDFEEAARIRDRIRDLERKTGGVRAKSPRRKASA
jgi:excinuclease ABC subunit B